MLAITSALSLSAFQASLAPATGAQRMEAVSMFGGGKKAAPKKGAAPTRRLTKSAANSKAASSATGRTSSFVDVTGKAYVEVDTFVPKYDEIGVMPPLGRWDPLQIREQASSRPRAPAPPRPGPIAPRVRAPGHAPRHPASSLATHRRPILTVTPPPVFAPEPRSAPHSPHSRRDLPLCVRQGPERYRRFVEMEIKHGRMSMAAVTGVLVTYSGLRWPGFLSTAEQIKFSDIPGGAISSWAALPIAAWCALARLTPA